MGIELQQTQLGKVFVELRHKEAFSLPDVRFKILDKTITNFPNYNMDAPDKLSVINPNKGQFGHFFLNRSVFDWDEPQSLQAFFKESLQLFDTVLPILKIDVLHRVGFRVQWKMKFNDKETVSKYIMNNYFKENFLQHDLADDIYEPGIRFSGRKGTIRFNFQLTTLHEQIMEAAINGPVKQQENHFLLIDLDVYRDNNQNPRNLNNFFRDANDFINNQFSNYLSNL
ncbi:hypothetical protein [Brevibacillus choshinensis]|uniref:hypothetical protein n=1 Tax=Brevibacillus choshinensis TaxID=54911 RepID=UPI002E20CEFA|nr:hypothetical protein [Brevibacillus choshinensis]